MSNVLGAVKIIRKMLWYSKISLSVALCVLLLYVESSEVLNRRSCEYDLHILWTKEVGHAPFIASPLIADIDADGELDIVAAPFRETLTVLNGATGKVLSNTQWPQAQTHSTVFASPLLHDVNGDNMDDILITTFDGEFLFYDHQGSQLLNQSFKLPKLFIDKEWFKREVSVEKVDIHSYILDEIPTDSKTLNSHTGVDAHVLATPVICDLNNDKKIEEMVVPVSYYYDLDYYSETINQEGLSINHTDLDKFVAGGLVIFNLTSLTVLRTIHLELTTAYAEYPGYILYTPTVVDLDRNGGIPEILIGSSGGQLHIMDPMGKPRFGFPVPKDTMHGQVTVADLTNDGTLEIVTMDTSSNVLCFSPDGTLLWETEITGSMISGMRVADVDLDGQLDLVIAANNGHIWALNGGNGIPLNGWPFKVGMISNPLPLVTRMKHKSKVDLVVLGDDEHLHIFSTHTKCRHTFSLRENSYTALLIQDLVPTSPGLEILVSTKDGSLICLGQLQDGKKRPEDRRQGVIDGFPADTRSHNNFMYSGMKLGVYIHRDHSDLIDVTGSWIVINYDIIDEYKQPSVYMIYRVAVYYGNELLATSKHKQPGTYTIEALVPLAPCKGHLKVVVTNKHGQVFQDRVTVRFNLLFLHDIPWLLLLPFLATVASLLILHGYPTKDLLPVTLLSKER